MNDPGFLMIVAWRTPHKRHQVQAEKHCKNYGLSKLQTALYIGRLSFKERREFEGRIAGLLSGRRDRLHLFTSCRSCAMNSNANAIIEKHYKETTFEIV